MAQGSRAAGAHGLATYCLVVLWTCARPAYAFAQVELPRDASEDRHADDVCFARHLPSECTTWILFEFSGWSSVADFASGRRGQEAAFDDRLSPSALGWDVGWTHSFRGGTLGASLGVELPRVRSSVRTRYRQWVSRDVAVDFAPGAVLHHDDESSPRPPIGVSFIVRTAWVGRGALGLRYDRIPAPAAEGRLTGPTPFDPSPPGHQLYIGGGLEAVPALWATAVVGGASLILLARFIAIAS